MSAFSSISMNGLNNNLDNLLDSQFLNLGGQNTAQPQVQHFQNAKPTVVPPSSQQQQQQQQQPQQQATPVQQLTPKQVYYKPATPIQTPKTAMAHTLQQQQQQNDKLASTMKKSGNVAINVVTQLTGKILFFIGLSLTLIAAFAWNDAIKGLVEKYINFSEESELNNIVYASLITLIVVVFTHVLKYIGVDIKDFPVVAALMSK